MLPSALPDGLPSVANNTKLRWQLCEMGVELPDSVLAK